MIRGRSRAALVIGAIVVGSALAGAALDRIILVREPRHSRPPGGMNPVTPEQEAKRRQATLDRMSKDLDLTPAQRTAIDSIMQRTDSSLRLIRLEMQPRLKEVFEASRAQIAGRLDPVQRAKFEASPRGGARVRGTAPDQARP